MIFAMLIAVLVCSDVQAGNKHRKDIRVGITSGYKGNITVGENCCEAVRIAGGVPLIFPLVRDSVAAEALVAAVDAIVVTGGEDIDPKYYGEDILNETVHINEIRDVSDVLILKAAVKAGKPMLGICRGEQIINVVLGGTLYQDLPSQVTDVQPHSVTASARGVHEITIDSKSRLGKIFGAETIYVNSSHHQAVKDPAPGLKVTARTSDGVVEAYEGFPKYDIIGIQSHPESYAREGNQLFLKIFQDLIERGRKARK